ncbi:MAG: T9SS type A sorting domain-containing protein [Bacteroidales bacterium]
MKAIVLTICVSFLSPVICFGYLLQAEKNQYAPATPESGTTTYINIGISQPNVEDCFETAVFEETKEQKMTVFPNPGTGLFFVKMPSVEPTTVNLTVYDISGKAVFEIEKPAQDTQTAMELNLEFLNSGMYFLRVRGSSKIFTHQIIIQQAD